VSNVSSGVEPTTGSGASVMRCYWALRLGREAPPCILSRGRKGASAGKERLISRWEHEAVLETVQARLDQHPEKMTMRRQTAEHPFGTIKCWMGATHFLTKRLPKVATEMALNVLAYNIKRVMAIIGVAGLLEALAA